MVQRYEQTRKLQWYKRGAAYFLSAFSKKVKGEEVKSHSCFRKKSVIKIFPNTYHLYLYIKPLLTFSIKRK